MSNGHAKLAPSASERWVACPGSIALIEKAPPEKPSPYAEEGTRAHAVAEACLRDWLNAEDYDGNANAEMREAVQVYLDYVYSLITPVDVLLSDKQIVVEGRFTVEWLHPDIFGTTDCCIYDAETKTVHVIDYKHGAGLVVEPEWNTQLMIYALGAYYALKKYEVDKFKLTVVQPRAYHYDGPVRSWDIDKDDLVFWGVNVLKPAAKNTEKENAKLRSGKHCRFCPAMAICPEQVRNACDIAQVEFADPSLPAPQDLDPAMLKKVLDFADVFKSWSQAVKEYARHQAASGVMKVPGYKLVKQSKNRQWIDENTAAQVLGGQLGQDAWNKKLKTPAQAEKELKKNNLSPEAVMGDLVCKPEGELLLVDESDKRKEVTVDLSIDFPDFE